MWKPGESEEIQRIAREATRCQDSALPRGLQVERGPGGVFEYIMEKLPES